ncbi:MAG: GMC family oxidoreductase, partial [Pseudomonadota bacterium]
MEIEYDVVVAGSGAGGGFCAMRLCQRGFRVLLLERGRRYDFTKDYPLNHTDWELHRDPLQKNPLLFERAPGALISAEDHHLCTRFYGSDGTSYRSATPKHRGEMVYQRAIGVGGSTLHYEGEAHRFPEHAFRSKSLYGWGTDWPIDYHQLAPYYDQAENILGVAGKPGNPFRPEPENYPTPAHPLSYSSRVFAEQAKALGWTVWPNTLALPTRSIDGRSPCQKSGGCLNGCIFGAKSSVDQTAIKIAEATGNLTLQTDSRLIRIETDFNGEVARYIYKHGMEEKSVKAKRYVLALGALETPRLLLHSKSASHPDGLGNQYDNVGRYFNETISAIMELRGSQIQQTYKGPPLDNRIWEPSVPKHPLKTGYSIGIAGVISSLVGPLSYARLIPGIGLKHKQTMREQFGRVLQIFGIAEHIPDRRNRVTLGTSADADGVPYLRLFSDYNELDKMALHAMIRDVERLSELPQMGRKVTLNSTLDRPGAAHVGGTCRFGDDPETSVTEASGRIHGMINQYIADGSLLPCLGPGDSPSLTIQA